MRSRRSVALVIATIATMACGASQVAAATLEKGTIELTPSLGFSRNSFSYSGSDAGSLTTLTANGLIGYCITDHVELGGGLLINYQSADIPGFGSESATSLGVVGGMQYNFSSGGQTIPFVRGAIGVVTNSGNLSAGDRTTVIAPAISAGLRVLVGSAASVNFGVGYQHQTSALGVQDLSANTFAMEIGVSIFPGR